MSQEGEGGSARDARLGGKVALITGGSGGIGQSVALALGGLGASIAFCYRSDTEGAAETLASLKSIGAPGFGMRADVSDEHDVETFVQQATLEFGHIDILVNNAAVLVTGPLVETTTEQWDGVMSVNLKGYFLCGRAVARRLIAQGNGGRIVNVSSVLAHMVLPNRTIYGSCKAAIEMLTKVWALELAPHGITVNTVAPGTIETKMNRDWLADGPTRAAMEEPIPLGRIGSTRDVAAAIAFLVSEDAAYVTGATLLVDGGASISPESKQVYITPSGPQQC